MWMMREGDNGKVEKGLVWLLRKNAKHVLSDVEYMPETSVFTYPVEIGNDIRKSLK